MTLRTTGAWILACGLALVATGCGKKPAEQAANVDTAPPAAAESYCDFVGGPEDAIVKVVGYYPGEHEETIAVLKELLTSFPGKVRVQIVDWRHEEGRKLRNEANLSCAGVTINGNNVMEIQHGEKTDSVAFTRGLSKGDWTAEDLKAAVEQELAKASVQ